MMHTSFGGLLRKETFHILRDRRTLAVVILMPIVQVLLFGFAIRTDVQEVRLAVVDPAPDARTLAVRDRFSASPSYRIVAVLPTASGIDELFQRGAADQAILFAPDFAASLYSIGGAQVQIVTDGAAPTTSAAIETFARSVMLNYQQELQSNVAPLGRGGPGIVVAAHVRHRFNPTLESRYLFVPGLLAFVLTIISTLMTAITLSREKETGTLEILLVSPLRPVHIVLGKVLPYLALAFFNAVTTLAVGWAAFGVPVRGSLLLLAGECLLFVAVCLALGVLISTRMPSQRASMIAVIVGTMLPTAILSGMIFPIESMPGWLQPVTHLIPAKWFIEIVRGIMLKGATLDTLWADTLILAGMTVVLLAAGVRSFSARLD
jgi:ABC-2 type transport system permease protein